MLHGSCYMVHEYANNPKAGFDYEILETLEAGILLKGYEVKAIKTGKASLRGAHVKIIDGKPALIGASIAPYQVGNTPAEYIPDATRTLLLSKKQIDTLLGLSKSHGVTLIPLKLYDKKGLIKLLIGIVKGKKKYDKRASIKKKDTERSIRRGDEP